MSTDLPPEAYTRETLQAAFDWLQTQPELVRTSVHTPERLVALYQKSQRLSDPDRPVSSKKFITDLKNLATSLDEFSGPALRSVEQAIPAKSSPSPVANRPSPAPTNPIAEPKPEPTTEREPTSAAPQPSPQRTTQTRTVKKASFELTTDTTEVATDLSLDATSSERVRRVQQRFNLSSESEALRLLIAIGYEKFSTFE